MKPTEYDFDERDDLLDEASRLGSLQARALGRTERESRLLESGRMKFYKVTWYSARAGKRTGFVRAIEAINANDAKRQAKAMVTNERAVNLVAKEVKRNPKKHKLSIEDAIREAERAGVNFRLDFYEQSKGVELAEIAKRAGYRKPQSASGSTGRYFFQYLKRRKNPGFFGPEATASAKRVKRVHLVKEKYTGEIGELLTQKPALLKEGWLKVKWRNRDKPTLIQRSEVVAVKQQRNPGLLCRKCGAPITAMGNAGHWKREHPGLVPLKWVKAATPGEARATFDKYNAARQSEDERELRKEQDARAARGESRGQRVRRNPAGDVISWDTHKVSNGYQFRVYRVRYNEPTETLKVGVAPTRARAVTQAKKWTHYLKLKVNPSRGGEGAGATSSDVRSPTRTSTEVRSPTKTSTVAHTRGNITVTGGAGAGATTSVIIKRARKNPAEIKPFAVKGKYATAVITKDVGSKFIGKLHSVDGGTFRVDKQGRSYKTFLTLAGAKTWARRMVKRFDAMAEGPSRNPSVNALAETFQGKASGAVSEYKASNSAPGNLARIGKLIFLKLRDVKKQIAAPGAMVAVDTRGKLWLVGQSRSQSGMFQPKAKAKGEALDYGEVDRICYLTAKQHISNGKSTEYVHTFGENGGARPHLLVDHEGMPILRGGDYKIQAEGIVN